MDRGRISKVIPVPRSADWHMKLATVIKDAPTDAILEVPTEAMRELGERAAARIGRPDLVFRVTELMF